MVNVSSRAHASGRLDLDDLQFERRGYHGMVVYGTSKLLNILFTRELARRLEGTGTTANCVHPGVIRSGFGKDEPGMMKWLVQIGAPFLQSPESGARGNIHLCTSPDVAELESTRIVFARFARGPPARWSTRAKFRNFYRTMMCNLLPEMV